MPNNSRFSIPIYISIIIPLIAVIGIVVNQVTTNVTANQAFAFIEKNRSLPSKVCELDRRICRNEKLLEEFHEVQSKQMLILDRIENIRTKAKEDQERIIKGLKDLQKRMEDALNGNI